MNSMVRGRDRDFLIQLRLDIMAETRYNIVHFLLQQKVSTLAVCFPCGSAGKESTCNAGDLGLMPGLGRSPGEGKGKYSGPENSMHYIVHGVANSRTQLSDFHFHQTMREHWRLILRTVLKRFGEWRQEKQFQESWKPTLTVSYICTVFIVCRLLSHSLFIINRVGTGI